MVYVCVNLSKMPQKFIMDTHVNIQQVATKYNYAIRHTAMCCCFFSVLGYRAVVRCLCAFGLNGRRNNNK